MTGILHMADRLSASVVPILLMVFFRVSVLAVLAFAASWLLRRSSPATRHTLWLTTICSALLVLVLSLSGPLLKLDLGSAATAPRAAADIALKLEGVPAALGVAAPTHGPSAAEPVAGSPVPWRAIARVAVGLFWVAGAAAGLLRLLYGRLLLRRLVRCGREVGRDDVRDFARYASVQGRVVRAIESDRCSTPLTCGLLRPVIVLPAAMRRWTPADRGAVLLHELLHIRRADSLSRATAFAISCFLWFIPLIWAAYRRLCLEQEKACDAAVVSSGVTRHSYADCLLEAAKICRGPAMEVGFSFLERRARTLRDRLHAILDKRQAVRRGTALVAVTACVLACVAASGSLGRKPINLFAVAQKGTPEQVRAALRDGGRVDARAPGNGLTPLMVAAGDNPDPAVVVELLDAGAELEAREYFNGCTALGRASAFGSNPRVIEILLQRGADPRGVAADGDTALIAAAWTNTRAEMLAPILQAGIGIDDINREKDTALMIAARYGNAAMIQALLRAGANAKLRNKAGFTAFQVMDPKLRGTEVAALLQAACR